MDTVKKTGLRVLIITPVLLLFYYFFFLLPQIRFNENLNQAENTLNLHYANLVQNRIAYIELSRLNPESVNFQSETASLVKTLQETQDKGHELVSSHNLLPDIKGFDIDFAGLLNKSDEFYSKQKMLLEKIIGSETYEEGLNILKSEESIELLTKQTNLIKEYMFWIDEIERIRGH